MASKFYALLTTRGEAKLAQAVALGTQLKITQMAVGDGGGAIPTPNASQTKLVNQQRIAAINTLSVDPVNTSQIIAEQVIPEDEGGWWIREVGLFDDAGELIAVANCAETYKPQLAEGSGRTQVIRMIVVVSSTEAVTLKIDPSVVLATRKYVDDKVIEVKAYTDSVMKAHLDAADPHPQYAPKASPTFTGSPKAPTPANGNNSTQLATTQFVQSAIALLVASSPAALDTLNELADALGNDPNFATTMTNLLALKAPLDSPTLTGAPSAPTAPVGTNTQQLANTAFVMAGLGLKANLASPALTGTPTAPTAAQTVNNTQIATTAFVKAALAALVDSSPAALDTLNELAAALGNDPNFATTVTNALALKAPLASPALTGTPTAPTAAQTVNNTQIATTAFVKAAITALNTALTTSLTGKQAADSTLTALSGKDVAGLIQYLGLGTSALYDVGTGSNQIPDMSAYELLAGDAGYVKLPNGFILQWGSATIVGGGSSNGALNVSYPVAFPKNFFQAVAVPRDLSAGTTAGNTLYLNFQTGTAPLTQLKVGVAGSNIGNLSFRYFAIGN